MSEVKIKKTIKCDPKKTKIKLSDGRLVAIETLIYAWKDFINEPDWKETQKEMELLFF